MKTHHGLLILIMVQCLSAINKQGLSQTILLGPQSFDTDILVHGSTAPTSVWFAPDYYTPVDYNATGGCTGGYAGYSGTWNNYWSNFLRTPEVNCTGTDTVVMSFDLSNSYIQGHTNDKVFFNMWADGAYHDASANQTIYFDEARNCTHFEVYFDVSPYINKNILFYLNASCGYNDTQPYSVKFDNIIIYSFTTTGQEERISQPIALFPNPSNGFFTVQFPNPEKELLTMIVYNTLGQVAAKTENISESEIKYDGRSLQSGLYYLYIKSDRDVIAAGKFIKP